MIRRTDFNNSIWEAPILPPIPNKLKDREESSICLTNRVEGEWQFLFETIEDMPSPFDKSQDYDFGQIDEKKWEGVIVPSSLIMQGYDIENNVEYYYRRKLTIPKAYLNSRIILRFEGVYSNARVWVNNKYIKTHVGGFTAWDCDLTEFVTEEPITVIIGVADIEGENPGIWNKEGQMVSDSSWASYYAHHNIGGILRNITLYALPQNYIARTHLQTVLDESYINATLKMDLQLHSHKQAMKVQVELYTANGERVKEENYTIDETFLDKWHFPHEHLKMRPDKSWQELNQEAYENDKKFENRYISSSFIRPTGLEGYSACIEMDVEQPTLWDAEHPYLYEVRVSLWIDNEKVQENCHKVGFRQISYGGMHDTACNKVYINGREIKLRGVCRHDVSYLYGRSLTNEEIRDEIVAYKKHNINHIRTSHYPASDYLLGVCDELGIYVEQENSACFKGDNGYGIHCAPQEFISSFAEMIESSRNHPSVIIWSLANESGFEKTYAFRAEYDYVKIADTTRPVIFSYPYTVKTTPLPYDLYSHHYAEVTGKLGNDKMPVLHDEFAHVPCYNLEDLTKDNSCREFWGESIKRGWENIFKTDGALGCAIWGGIDDVFYIPEGTSKAHQEHSKGRATGYGEWGAVLDSYKREKPEAYLTKKAFSPIRLDEGKSIFGKGITLYVSNWFDHASLNEVKLICTDTEGNVLYDDLIKENIMPHQDGIIYLEDVNTYSTGIELAFYFGETLVDTYYLSEKTNELLIDKIKARQGFQTEVVQDEIKIMTTSSRLIINKNTGKVVVYRLREEDKVVEGPYFYLDGKRGVVTEVTNITYRIQNGIFYMTAYEVYENKLKNQLDIIFDGENLHTFIKAIDKGDIEQLQQFGVEYSLFPAVEAVKWKRKGLYSSYPLDHIGRNEGIAYLRRKEEKSADTYGIRPNWIWEQDMANYFLFEENSQEVTNDFRMRRHHILEYTVQFENRSSLGVKPIEGHLAALVHHTANENRGVNYLQLTCGYYYPSISWGNYCGEPLQIHPNQTFAFKLELDLI
ncbi:glycoside hydrolase family 2 protein [Niameybacter massiliensis]|uniref:glycoside hydrolase family 2 protein n=1 Tax=Niameybacter massiliensis TaxID=1658108 RepID=UPI0006B4954E|nr:glycoside hydrolase family 2 [Niameybacter massiliensis]